MHRNKVAYATSIPDCGNEAGLNMLSGNTLFGEVLGREDSFKNMSGSFRQSSAENAPCLCPIQNGLLEGAVALHRIYRQHAGQFWFMCSQLEIYTAVKNILRLSRAAVNPCADINVYQRRKCMLQVYIVRFWGLSGIPRCTAQVHSQGCMCMVCVSLCSGLPRGVSLHFSIAWHALFS